LLYVNDIVNCSNILQFILFADDTNAFVSASSYQELMITLNVKLGKLSEWFRANKLSINLSKTKYVLFGCKSKVCCSPPLNIQIDKVILENVKFIKLPFILMKI